MKNNYMKKGSLLKISREPYDQDISRSIYANLDFATSVKAVKASGLLIAISESIFLLMSTSANFKPCMNLL